MEEFSKGDVAFTVISHHAKKKIVFALSMQQNPEPEHLHPVGVRFSSMTPVLFLHP